MLHETLSGGGGGGTRGGSLLTKCFLSIHKPLGYCSVLTPSCTHLHKRKKRFEETVKGVELRTREVSTESREVSRTLKTI